MRILKFVFQAVKDSLVGGILVGSWFLSIWVVGWTYQLMRQYSSRKISKGDFCANRERFDEEVTGRSLQATPSCLRPNWIRKRSKVKSSDQDGFLQRNVGMLLKNFHIGGLAILNTWIITLPGCALWTISWWAGWSNSFSKGYEMSGVGPGLGLFGVLLFVLSMLYLPLAQAHQAFTGDWKAFYQGRLILRLITTVHLRLFILAIGYAVFSFIIFVLVTMPMFFPQNFPALSSVSSEDVQRVLRQYYFWVGLGGFWFFVLLKIFAANVYATGVLTLSKSKEQSHEVGSVEMSQRYPFRKQRRGVQCERIISICRPAFCMVILLLTAIVWTGVSFEVYVAEFFNFHRGRGFMNHPLIHLPWFLYLPS